MSKYQLSVLWQPRVIFGGIFITCVALIAYALYLQHVLGLEPCPMCILQRYAFIAIAIVAVVGAIHRPRSLAGFTTYGCLIVLFAMAGGGVSIRHSWLQHFPTKSFSCGADLGYLLNTF